VVQAGKGTVMEQASHRDTGVTSWVAGYLLSAFLAAFLVSSTDCVGASTAPEFGPIKQIGFGSLYGLEVSPAGGRYLTASGNGLQLWTLDGRLTSTPISGTSVYAEWSPDGTRIAATLANRSYRILSVDGRILSRAEAIAPGDTSWYLDTVPVGDWVPAKATWVGDDPIVMMLGENKIGFWGLQNATLLGVIPRASGVMGSAWSHNTKLLAVNYGQDVYIYDARNWSVAERIPEQRRVLNLSWSPDGTKLTCAEEGRIYIWDVLARKKTAESKAPGSPGRMAWSPDGSLLAVSFGDWVRIYDGTTLDSLLSLGPTPPHTWLISWIPDGSRLYTGSLDGWVTSWDLSPRPCSTLRQESGVTRVRYSGTGLLAVGLASGRLRCLSGPNLERVEFAVDVRGGAVSGLDWSNDSSMVAAGFESGMVAVWSSRGDLGGMWNGHSGRVNDLGWHPEGELLATVGEDGFLAFWDRLGKEIRKVYVESELSKRPVSLAWSPSGDMVAVGYGEGTVRIWGYPGLDLQNSPFRISRFTSLDWAPRKAEPGLDLLAGGGSLDGLVLVWDAWGRTGFYQELGDHRGEVTDLSWSPDGSMLATCSRDGSVKVWHMVQPGIEGPSSVGGVMETFAAGTELTSVDWSPDGSLVASSRQGALYRWEAAERLVWSKNNHTSTIQDITWSPDSGSIAFDTAGRGIGIYNLGTDIVETRSVERIPSSSRIMSVDWSSDGTRIAVGDEKGNIAVVDPRDGSLFTVSQRGEVRCVEWSPDSSYLASGSTDGMIRIWDGHTGSLLTALSGHTGPGVGITWSSDGKWLGSSSLDGTVNLWQISTGTVAKTFRLVARPGEAPLQDVSWSPDMSCFAALTSRLFVVGVDGSEMWTRDIPAVVVFNRPPQVVWSPTGSLLAVEAWSRDPYMVVFSRSGQPLCNLTGACLREVLEWSPDGRYIGSGGDDGVLRIYDAEAISEAMGPIILLLISLLVLRCVVAGQGLWACLARRSRGGAFLAGCAISGRGCRK